MITGEYELLPDSADNFRLRLEQHDWESDNGQLAEAVASAHDIVVGVLGQMSAYHGTLPSLIDDIRVDGLRGDVPILQSETLRTFQEFLVQEGHAHRPDIRQRLDAHHFRPDSPVYLATDKSTASTYGFPEASRFILQGLIHISMRPATSEVEVTRLTAMVTDELDRLLVHEGDTTTAVVALDVAHPSILPNLTTIEHIARLSEAAEHMEPRMLDRVLAQHNLPIYNAIPATAITGVDYIRRDYGNWRDTILSGRGQSIFA